jgi:ubiquinone biosynthesis protein COQ9
MTKGEVNQSLKMFEKFLESEKGLEIAHRYSDDIWFQLDDTQTITGAGDSLYPRGKYNIFIKVGHPFGTIRMVSWKNQPKKQDIEKDLEQYLPYFGFSSQVGIAIM